MQVSRTPNVSAEVSANHVQKPFGTMNSQAETVPRLSQPDGENECHRRSPCRGNLTGSLHEPHASRRSGRHHIGNAAAPPCAGGMIPSPVPMDACRRGRVNRSRRQVDPWP